MPRWNIARKANPAKKAWKSFKTKFRPNLQKLLRHSVPAAVRAAARRLITSLASVLPSKLRTISNPNPNPNPRPQTRVNNRFQQNPSQFPAIRIDELFDQRVASASVENSGNKNTRVRSDAHGLEYGGPGGRSEAALYSVEEVWKAVVAASPELRCVDERAEEFIVKFRQDMKLQKEKSILEFQEMLARGA